MKATLALLALLTACVPPVCVLAHDVRDDVIVSTFSGSGEAGFADGPARSASFVMPSALAYDSRGYLYVADSAAQRIRRVDGSGAVVTIAGSGSANGAAVAGGYADGPGSQAKFSTPSGVSVTRSGTIYVADTYNHCIRAISPSGIVTTYAGLPLQPGYRDGPREESRFSRPMGLALDEQENLYVADADVGVRRIDVNTGTVTTLQLAVFSPFNLAILHGGTGDSRLIVIADAQGIKYIDGDRHGQFDVIDQYANFKMYELPPYHHLTQGGRPLGAPYGLAAIGGNSVAFSDLRGYSMRALDLDSGSLSILAGPSTEDAAQSGGGTADGPGSVARFGGPMGVALSPAGDLAVADAGSRRIRILRGFTQRAVQRLGNPAGRFERSAASYRFGYVGNSSIWWNTDWSSSIPSKIETSIESDITSAGKGHAEVLPVRLSQAKLADSIEDINNLIRSHSIDAIVLQINSGSVLGDFQRLGPLNSRALVEAWQDWAPSFTQNLRTLNESCRRGGVGLLVVVHPAPWELAPTESLTYRMLGGDITPNWAMEPELVTAVHASGARVLDLWPAFAEALKRTNHAALFGSYDFHFTEYGRAVAAAAIAVELRRWAPWRSR